MPSTPGKAQGRRGSATDPTRPQRSTSRLTYLHFLPQASVHLRDGEVVVYRRAQSPLWQCRFKLRDGGWVRLSTGHATLERAIPSACLRYDEARFRQGLGLAHRACTFTELAHETLTQLRAALDAGGGKSVYASYITCIERYFLPYFADRQLEQLTAADIAQFEAWRNRQMGRVPKASTLGNFAAAWSRLQQVAVARGWISDKVAIPKLSARGEPSRARPAFSKEEVETLLAYMQQWSQQGLRASEREMRPLLRDYVEVLLWTGIRHGTEARGLCWNHVEWNANNGTRYLRLWVDGKTGGRWLIAKHRAIEPLQRLHARQRDIAGVMFDELLASAVKHPVFRFSTGHQPAGLNGSFRRLMRDSGLLKSAGGQNRTLYSLRHTYATLALLEGMDIHTLSKQMGNSAAMIERHYSKLTATMAAGRLA